MVAVLAPGFGIGTNTGIFSIVNSVLLRPPPYREPGRVISVWKIPQEDHVNFSSSELAIWRKQAQVFENLGASAGSGFTLTGRRSGSFPRPDRDSVAVSGAGSTGRAGPHVSPKERRSGA
ncbi:MAG: hypothetical protein ACR2NN_29225 [Bryobacteraceae bacterium]